MDLNARSFFSAVPCKKMNTVVFTESILIFINNLFQVMPFVRNIRKWVATQKRRNDHRRRSTQPTTPNPRQRVSRGEPVAPFGSMEFMPRAWKNFTVKRTDLFQAMDQVLTHHH